MENKKKDHIFRYGTRKEHLESATALIRVSDLKTLIGLAVPDFPADEMLVLEVAGDFPDRILKNEEEVEIVGTPHFFSESHVRLFRIILNLEAKEVERRVWTFDQLVHLAFPDPDHRSKHDYTITFSKAAGHRHEGNLVEGQTLKVKNGTNIHVTPTYKS